VLEEQARKLLADKRGDVLIFGEVAEERLARGATTSILTVC